jgi:hypothetical protein
MKYQAMHLVLVQGSPQSCLHCAITFGTKVSLRLHEGRLVTIMVTGVCWRFEGFADLGESRRPIVWRIRHSGESL